LYKLHMW